MDFLLTPDQQAVCDAVQKICADFDDDYWLAHDKSGEFPEDFYRAIAAGGWLGIAMPEEYGGAGLGVTEAALMMHTVANSAGAMSAASAIHMNIFGPHPIVVFGTDEQRKRWLPDLIEGRSKSCFRRHRAGRWTEYDVDQDARRAQRRRLYRPRQKDLDIYRAGGRQDNAARSHDTEGGV